MLIQKNTEKNYMSVEAQECNPTNRSIGLHIGVPKWYERQSVMNNRYTSELYPKRSALTWTIGTN